MALKTPGSRPQPTEPSFAAPPGEPLTTTRRTVQQVTQVDAATCVPASVVAAAVYAGPAAVEHLLRSLDAPAAGGATVRRGTGVSAIRAEYERDGELDAESLRAMQRQLVEHYDRDGRVGSDQATTVAMFAAAGFGSRSTEGLAAASAVEGLKAGEVVILAVPSGLLGSRPPQQLSAATSSETRWVRSLGGAMIALSQTLGVYGLHAVLVGRDRSGQLYAYFPEPTSVAKFTYAVDGSGLRELLSNEGVEVAMDLAFTPP
jgi:hypothetical protein